MPVFTYKAKKDSGETILGEVTAGDVREAVDLVSRMSLLPVAVDEKVAGTLPRPVQNAGAARSRGLLALTKQLVILLKSGIPLLKAVDMIAQRTRDTRLSGILSDISVNIRNGRSFSMSLTQHSDFFPLLYIAMCRAGEESGKLKELLGNVAIYYRKQEEIAQRVRTALVYPLFMAVVGLGTVIFILTFVLPRIIVLFRDLNSQLPLPTLIVMRLSDFFQKAWPAFFVLFFIAVVLSRSAMVVLEVRRFFLQIVTALPFFKELVLKIDLERFTRTLSLLLQSGIPILRALEISVPTVANDVLSRDLNMCQSKIAGGAGFAEALASSTVVPEAVSQLISVGEESGELARALADIAETYEEEISETTKALTALLEPALILAVGLVVGFLVFAMLMPIFQMDVFTR